MINDIGFCRPLATELQEAVVRLIKTVQNLTVLYKPGQTISFFATIYLNNGDFILCF